MASVATPEYVVKIENLTPALPPVPERTSAMVMSAIESWPYWQDIKSVAAKEYGIEPEQFDALLPEYQRYIGLAMIGFTPLGMFSFDVDKVWHSHVLCTHLWADFCLRLHGKMINHVAQIPDADGASMQCTVCVSCTNCSIKCSGGDSGSRSAETPAQFAAAYAQAYGVRPPAVWDLSAREPDGCAAE